jgi:hypothetical protein
MSGEEDGCALPVAMRESLLDRRCRQAWDGAGALGGLMAVRRGERRTRRRTAALARARSIATGNGVRYAYDAAPDSSGL